MPLWKLAAGLVAAWEAFFFVRLLPTWAAALVVLAVIAVGLEANRRWGYDSRDGADWKAAGHRPLS